MNQNIIKKIETELRADPKYGASIKMIKLVGEQPNQLEVDVVASLENTEAKRELGSVLASIAHKEQQESGLTLNFHQYHPDNYN